MKVNFPNGDWDIEREYLFNDELAREKEYEGYLKVMNSPEYNASLTKIEVNKDDNGRQKRTEIEVNREESKDNNYFERTRSGF